MTTTTATALDALLADVAARAPRATLIRNSPTLAHVCKPNRVRSRWVLCVTSDGRVSGTLHNGRGYVEGSWDGITAGEIVGAL